MKFAVVYIVDSNAYNLLYKSMFFVMNIYNDVDIYVYFLDDGIQFFNDSNVHYINCKKIYDQYITSRVQRKRRISQLKWAIPLFDIFSKYENILYLDADTLMFKNIDEFIDIDTSKQIVGVSEMRLNEQSISKTLFPIYKGIGIILEDYINSGVLLFKTKNFTQVSAEVAYEKAILYHNAISFPWGYDQHIVNLAFSIEYCQDLRYNYYVCDYNKPIQQFEKDACIKHYFDKSKFFLEKLVNPK